MSIFRKQSAMEKQLEKRFNIMAQMIRDGISDDKLESELEELEKQRQQIWASMSPRLKKKLLEHVERRRNAKNKKGKNQRVC